MKILNETEELTKGIITKEDFVFFIEEIAIIENVIFKNPKTPLLERLKGKIKEELRNKLEKLEEKGIISNSPNQQIAFFSELKERLQKIPQVKLEIAFKPSRDFLLKLADWFKEKIHQRVILDLTINPKIIGGAIIEYQGSWRNFSLAKKIDKLNKTLV